MSVQALAAQTAANFANLFKVDLAAASLNEVDFTALGVQSLNPYKLERVMHTL